MEHHMLVSQAHSSTRWRAPMCAVVVQSLSCIQFFVTLWTAVCQAFLSFHVCRSVARKGWKWKSLSRVWLFVTPWTIHVRTSPGQNTGVNVSLLQGVCPTQGSNIGLLNCRWILCQLSHKGSAEQERIFLELVAQLPTSFLEIETISFLLESKQNISRRGEKNGIRGFIILDYEHGSRGKSWEQGKDIDILYIYYSLSISFAQKAQTMQKYWEIKRKLSPIRFSIFPIYLIIFLMDHYSDL